MSIKKDCNKSYIKSVSGLILSAAVLILSLVLFASHIFGWLLLSENKAEISGVESHVETCTALADYTVYSYIVENENTSVGTANTDLVLSAITFQAYDRTFVANNPFTSVFVKISFSAYDIPESGSIKLRINRNKTPVDPVNGQPLTDDSVSSTLENRCTSVMRFSFGIDKTFTEIASAPSVTDGNTALYNAVNNSFYNAAANGLIGSTFVTKTVQGGNVSYEKGEFIFLECPFTSAMWNTNGQGVRDTLNTYLYMSYDSELINDYVTQHQMIIGASEVDAIINDLSELIVICTE